VIHLFHMRDFVGDHIVEHKIGRENETPGK
jgi:hypothetical protein